MPGDVWSGLLGGFVDRKRQVELENQRSSDLAAERENRVFSTLLNSDDPEVSKMALAGLLHSSDPRQKAKGLKGWVGETMASPYMAKIDALLQTPVQTQESYQIPGVSQNQGIPGPIPGMELRGPMGQVQPAVTTPPPAQGAAGMPPQSPVQPGGAPPTPVGWTQAPPTPITLQRTVLRSREAFLPPTEKAIQMAGAKELGDIGGMRAGLKAAGFSDADATSIIQRHIAGRYGASAVPFQHVAVEAPDGKGGFYRTMASYNRITGEYLDDSQQPIYGARPVSSTASQSLGVNVEPLARAMYGKRGVDLTQDEMAHVLEAGKLQKGVLTPKDAIAAAQRFLPNATIDAQMQLADALLSGTQATVGPAGQAGPPAPSGAAAVQQQIGGAVEQPSPTGVTPPPTPAAGGKPKIQVPPELGTATKESGKPIPPAVATSLAKAKSTNDLIDQALAALEPFKSDTSLKGGIDLATKYRQGVYDPVSGAAAQLADLAGLQSSAQAQLTGGASRALQFYVDRRQHVPKLPSIRQVQAAQAGIPAGAVQWVSGAIKDDAGTFDSPQQMYEKLLRAKQNNENFIRELESATRESVRPIPSHGQNTATPGQAYKDANGVWHIKQ